MGGKDFFDDIVKIISLMFIFLFLFSLLPEFETSVYKIKKIDLLSDIRKDFLCEKEGSSPLSNDDTLPVLTEDSLFQSDKFKTDCLSDNKKESPNKIQSDSAHQKNQTRLAQSSRRKENLKNSQEVIPFEDYSSGKNALAYFVSGIKNLKNMNRPIRIAFLGDSFIEADIITSNIREQLQQKYGGRGVGFVPMASAASGYRRTIVHKFSKWKTYSMVYYKKADWNKLMLSGQYFIPEEGATASFKGTNNIKFVDSFNSAQLLFINEKKAKISVKVNNGETKIFTPPSDTKLQSIELTGEIHSLDFEFSNIDGFIGFGLLLNDYQGIYVDNFSVRGSSGLVLSTVNKDLCEELKEFISYDLIVLQYGLNVISATTTNYSSYKKRMVSVVEHLRNCFPETSFIVMGIGDRSVRGPKGFESMPSIPAMIETQREIAKETNVAFWNTFDAMGGTNSMQSFVNSNPPLANKDYTHINHAGGKRIANAFMSAINAEIEAYQ